MTALIIVAIVYLAIGLLFCGVLWLFHGIQGGRLDRATALKVTLLWPAYLALFAMEKWRYR